VLRERRDRAAAFAGRWAAKEAAIKAFAGKAGGHWHDFEVLRDSLGAPGMTLRGRAGRIASTLRVARVHVSITHDAGVAAAVVVLEGQ